MKKRWLIRSLFLLPLVCVVGVWVGSYLGSLELWKWSKGDLWYAGVAHGSGFCFEYPNANVVTADLPIHFRFGHGTTGKEMVNTVPTMFGFYYSHPSRERHGISSMVFPLWAPTLLLLALNWFVWRKTLPKMAAERSFPVELTAKSGVSKP